MKSILHFVFISFFISQSGFSQNINWRNSSSIVHRLEKLKVLGSVLYVAAHPDDENTGMITYFANERKMKTTYLSLTRGDGGQNLIGPEKYEWMGLIRTQELLEARKIDGGQQAFTRAFDFGYSKTPKETLKIWNQDSILSDVVWAIRRLQPDIIITRFAPDTLRETHGHHTSSSLLANQAFGISGDKNSYPDQLMYVEPWQAKRIFFNTSWWFYGSRDFDKTGLIELETGQYNPLLGQSYGEISAESRSMHKSQGFGVLKNRGSNMEYLKPSQGEPAQNNPFDGIDISWTRVKGGEGIEDLINAVIESFEVNHPENSLENLIKIRQKILLVKNDFWRTEKLGEIDGIIQDCLGIWVEAMGEGVEVVPGNKFPFTLTAIQRMGEPLKLQRITCEALNYTRDVQQIVKVNELLELRDTIQIPDNIQFTVPYWIKEPMEMGRFVVKDQRLIGKPENDPDIPFDFIFQLGGKEFVVRTTGIYKWRDRVNGEMDKELVVVPPMVACFNDKNIIFPSAQKKLVVVKLNANKEIIGGEIRLDLPKGWKSSPEKIEVSMKAMEEKRIEFMVIPTEKNEIASAGIRVLADGKSHTLCRVQIEHPHIKSLSAVIDNHVKFVRADINNNAKLVGYVDGAGDEIPQALMQLGAEVKYLEEEDFFNGSLGDFDAIVMGVRAYNTMPWLVNVNNKLMEYVQNGGNLVVQYNVTYGLVTQNLGPYPFKISRDRVTDENAVVTILNPSSEFLQSPNKISPLDFEGWVQERGLYFPESWDEKYEALIECHDPGEPESKGALLVCSYGKGTFTYSGLSWFRQLPAGVGGAYRIFANLISAKTGT